MITSNMKAIEILMVEDNPGDVILTEEGFKKGKLKNNLYVVTDGVAALDFLRKEGSYSNAIKPDLILLDLNLPKKNGQEVLVEIKQDPELRTIPVVILTSSTAEEDIVKSYKLHANCYISKPVNFDEFIKIVNSIEDFWFSIARIPNRNI